MKHDSMTVGELTDYFATVSRQRVHQVLRKYQNRGDRDTVRKITQAKKALKERKKEAKNAPLAKQRHAARLYTVILARIGKRKAYLDCTEAWKCEESFSAWAVHQVGFMVEGFELDKDLLVKGNRVYGPDTCVFVPAEINVLLSGCYRAARRGKYPIGVCFNKGSGRFKAQMSSRQSRGLDKYLGSFPTVEEAFACYKAAKEARMRTLAAKWKDQIDPRAYDALMKRAVEMDD